MLRHLSELALVICIIIMATLLVATACEYIEDRVIEMRDECVSLSGQ